MKKAGKIFIIVFIVLLIFITASYCLVFGRALKQNENYLAIALALPGLIVKGGVEQINDSLFIVKNDNDFVREIVSQGYVFKEQMGSGYFFEKSGESFLATSRKYSAYFTLFNWPAR